MQRPCILTKHAPIALTTQEVPRDLGAVSVKMPALSNIPAILGAGHITGDKRDKHCLFMEITSSWRLNSNQIPKTSPRPDTSWVNNHYLLIED